MLLSFLAGTYCYLDKAGVKIIKLIVLDRTNITLNPPLYIIRFLPYYCCLFIPLVS